MQILLVALSIFSLSFNQIFLIKCEIGRGNPKLYAKTACLYDCEGERFLYDKSGDTKCSIASTTKIMTLIIALEYGNLEEIVTFSENASKKPDVQMNAKEGERYILEDLCYAMMLESYNDVAVAIAEHISGSEEAFAKLMNEKAYEIGCVNTHFVTANGLDKKDEEGDHESSAKDLALIAAYGVKNEKFMEIIGRKSYSFKELDNKRSVMVNNKNMFLDMYDGACGIKTGFTCKAGYCFVGYVKKEDGALISVVLGSGWPPNKTYKWQDTKKLMDYGLQIYKKVYLWEDLSLLLAEDETVVLCHNNKDMSISLYINGKMIKKYTKTPI